MVLQSATEVEVTGRLVDLESGRTLWDGEMAGVVGSSNGGGGLIGMAISALVTQVLADPTSRSLQVARSVNASLFGSNNTGLLRGPLHPDYAVSAQPAAAPAP